jgi:transcriptional regulator with XRE-family HTH domain
MQTEYEKVVGLRLKAARIALGYNDQLGARRNRKTQVDFYQMLGYSKGRANNWERGICFPPPEFMVALYGRFGINPDWLLIGRADGLPDKLADTVAARFDELIAGGGPLTPDADIIATYLAGNTLQETGERYDIDRGTVRRILIRNNVDRRPRRG